MNDQFVATVLLYLVPLFALLVTWKKPLSKALGWIAASEILGLLLFLPLYALVGLLGWEWYSWGGVSLQEILAYWQESGLTALAWILPGLGETAAVSIVEQRKGKQYLSVEEFSADCPKVTKAHIELLRACGALGNLPETSQMTLF